MSCHESRNCKSGAHGCTCGGCEGDNHFHRRFQTKEEQISELETYLADLKAEVQAVEERLSDLRK